MENWPRHPIKYLQILNNYYVFYKDKNKKNNSKTRMKTRFTLREHLY